MNPSPMAMDTTRCLVNAMLQVNYESIPKTLTSRKQWVVWRLEHRPNSKKPTKVPYNALNGRHAKSNDPATWCDFNRAGQLARRGDYDGIGFAFAEGDGLAGIDLDHVIDAETGELAEWAVEVVERFKGSYIERSPSGTGLRIFALGSVERCGKGATNKNIELYNWQSPRYLTVTGQLWPFCSAEPTAQQDALVWLHRVFFAKEEPKKKAPAPRAAPLGLDDEAILAKALAKPKFAALWNGQGGEDHSADDLSLCCSLAFWFGGDEARIDRMFRASGLIRDKWDVKHSADGRTYGQMTIAKALAVVIEFYDPSRFAGNSGSRRQENATEGDGGNDSEAPPANGEDRPKIQIGGDMLVRAMQQAERVLFRGDTPPFFQRDGLLMRLAAVDQMPDDEGRIKRPVGATVLAPVTAQWLRRQMMLECKFVKWNSRKLEMEAQNLPKDYAESYLDGGEWWAPVLRNIVYAPLLRQDGTVMINAGFDSKSGIYMASNLKVKHPPPRGKNIHINPQKDEAVRWACDLFADLFASFEPETGADLSVLVSGILAGLLDPSLVRHPGIVITSPIFGTGKGKIADMISIILTGNKAPKMTMVDDPKEFKKSIFSALLAGDRIICIDEIEYRLKSSALNSAMVEDTISDRVLGISKNAHVRTDNTLFMALGNNISVSADATRRWLRCYLNPRCAEPHKRSFERDPIEYVSANRAKFITAGLTILHGFFFAGKPRQSEGGVGSYEGWNTNVRDALIWAGFADPWSTVESWKTQDDDLLQLSALLASWFSLYGEEPKTVANVCVDLNEAHLMEDQKNLKSVIDEIALDRGKLNTRKLGNRIKKNKSRIVAVDLKDISGRDFKANLMFESAGASHSAQLWRVVGV